jgi:D-3-phosphoglycerate dehydrogenase
MLGMIDAFRPLFEDKGVGLTAPEVVQAMSEQELRVLVPRHDGWIIGDDPATRAVLTAGRAGRLRAAVKWGIGTDNVDFAACRDLGIPVTNTPNMFGAEVADVAVGYVVALARQTFEIDRGVRAGDWPKPRGISLYGRTAAILGFGDIGRNVALRLAAAGMNLVAYDPAARDAGGVPSVAMARWPDRLQEADFVIVTCALTESSRHLLNADTLARCRKGVRIVNVSRGPVIHQPALIAALRSGQVYSAALDVFEQEPLPMHSALREHPRCVFGSHNSSNTSDAVERTSRLATHKLFEVLGCA